MASESTPSLPRSETAKFSSVASAQVLPLKLSRNWWKLLDKLITLKGEEINNYRCFSQFKFRRTDRNRGTLQPFAFCTFKDDAVASSLAKTRWIEIEGKRCEVKLCKFTFIKFSLRYIQLSKTSKSSLTKATAAASKAVMEATAVDMVAVTAIKV